MRDVQVVQYYRSAKACAARAAARTATAPEWERLAKCWEFLAQIHETMPLFSTERPRADQDEEQKDKLKHHGSAPGLSLNV